MSRNFKQFIASIVISIIIVASYFGNFLPFKKSTSYILALRNLNQYRSVGDFEQAFEKVFNFYSPIGQEELVRNTISIILGFLRGPKQPQAVVDELVRYIEYYAQPIVSYGRGMSFGQNIYLLGSLNLAAFYQTNNEKYLSKAESYYKKGLTISPRRPQYLYGLLEIYRVKNNYQEAEKMAKQILSFWPEDKKVENLFQEILSKREIN